MPIWALYLITVAIWGSSWYGIKEQLGIVAPTVSIAYRFLLAAAILWVFCLATRRSVRFRARDHVWMAAQGLCLFCGNYILFYFAGMHLVSGLLAVCFSTMSLMNVVNPVSTASPPGASFFTGSVAETDPELAAARSCSGGFT